MIYKTKSGRWSVLVDVEDPQPYRLVAEAPLTRNGRRRPQLVGRFRTQAEGTKELEKLVRQGDVRALSVERIARGRRTVGTYGTKKEAEQAERAALTAKDRGVDLAPSTVTVTDLVERYVANQLTREDIGLQCSEEYLRSCKLYIEPHFGSLMVKKLRPAAINEWIVAIMQAGGRKGKPISARTAKHAFALLSASLRWGVKMQIVGQNVCEFADPPSPQRSEARALSSDDVGALLQAARGSRWAHFVELALLSGARRGELLALTWDDVDLEVGQMIIRASLSQTKGATAIKSTKTGRVRIVPLIPAAIEVFRRQRVQQNHDRLSAGEVYEPDPRRPVFTDEIGRQLTPKAATHAFARLAGKAGVAITSLHSTRHTTATELIASGVDVRTVAAILGHSNPTVTLSVYSHAIEGVSRAAMGTLGTRIDGMRGRTKRSDENATVSFGQVPATQVTKKPRRSEVLLVAGTGFEPVTFGL